jgi:hypothetical protein
MLLLSLVVICFSSIQETDLSGKGEIAFKGQDNRARGK